MRNRLLRHGPLLIGALALLAAAPAAAQDEDPEESDPYTRDGWYAGLQTAKGFENFANGSGLGGEDVRAWGLSARVGWRDLTYLAVEAQYEFVQGFRLRGSAVEVDVNTLTLNLKGYLPLGRLQPFALAGFGFTNMDVGGQGTVAQMNGLEPGEQGNVVGRFGLGADLSLTRNWVLTAEASYVLPAGKLDDLEYFTVGWGFQYRFEPFIY